jgi:RNA polymerase sigma-54 factor
MPFVRPGVALLGLSLPDLQAHAKSELLDNPLLEERRAVIYGPRKAQAVAALSLPEYLAEQLRIVTDDRALLAIGEFLIGNLNEDGYLQLGVSEAAELAEVSLERVVEVLKLIHGFDPPGVAARTLQECLILQIESRETPYAVAVEIETRHLEDLAAHRYGRIARALAQPLERVRLACNEIRRLEPKPGRHWGVPIPASPVPDVVLEKSGEGYDASPGDGWPRLCFREGSCSWLARGDSEALAYLRGMRRRARALLQAIRQKRDLLCRVAESLGRRQRAFFEGESARFTRVVRGQIARELGTSDRVLQLIVRHAHMQTPRGLFRVRDFLIPGRPRSRDEGAPPVWSPHGSGSPPRRPAAVLSLPAPAPDCIPTYVPRALEVTRRPSQGWPRRPRAAHFQ